jgi:hypothetical protein
MGVDLGLLQIESVAWDHARKTLVLTGCIPASLQIVT